MYVIDHKINKSMHRLRDTLTSEYLDWLFHYGNEIKTNKRTLARKAISCFLLNAYKPTNKQGTNIGLTLRESSFSGKVIVNGYNSGRKVSYKYTRSFLDFLVERKYISLYIGGKANYEFLEDRWVFIDRERSYATLQEKLIVMFNTLVGTYEPQPITNVIRLRDKNKKEITFKHTEVSKEVRDSVYGYNSFSLGYEVSCHKIIYDVQVYKIHNESLQRGGRSFMKDGIQHLSGEERKHIEIDGESVCIFDYKGFEPSLCYTMCQEVFEGEDYYTIDMEGYDTETLRSITKLALLIMFNTKGRQGAHSAINEILAQEFDVPELHKQGKVPYQVIPVKRILDELESKHHLISHKFYKGFGNELQYAGSLIIDYVTDYMMQTHKCLVLSVFDECIAKEEFRELLYSAMVEAYENVLGFSDNCKITVEQ